MANRLMGHITALFQDARDHADRFKQNAKSNEILQVHTGSSTSSELGPPFNQLHEWSRRIVSQHQKNTNILSKASWAIYEKKDLDKLIVDLTSNVDSLIGLFPAIQIRYEQLCDSDISTMQDSDQLDVLAKAAKGRDSVLEGRLKAVFEKGGHT